MSKPYNRWNKHPILGDLPYESGVYRFTINNKCYIGFSKNMRSRCQNHLSSLRHNTHQNWKLQLAWNTYETGLFEVVELTTDETQEIYWIEKFNTLGDTGYNILKGLHPQEETLIKLRSYRHTDESKKKITNALTGRHHSEETKAKMRKAQLGKKLSAETKAKIKLNHRCNKNKGVTTNE